MKDPKRPGRYIWLINGELPEGEVTGTKKYKVTSPYNKERDNPVSGKREVHSGTDIVGTTGLLITQVPNKYTMKYDAYNGLMMTLEFNDKSVLTICHLQTGLFMTNKDKTAFIVGYMGTSGNSTGPHYHMEYYRPDGTKADALEIIDTDKILQL